MKLDELGVVGRGKSKHRPRSDPSLYGGSYPFIQTGDVKEADLWVTQFNQTYNEKGLAQSKLWPVGTLCITIAANIAETAILKLPACFPDSIVGFRPHPGMADARFIKYYIDTLKVRMQNASKGTTQDNLSVDKLTTFEFAVPEFSVQKRSADILSAYDDLIENNTRRITLLEEMAQKLYREWFVHFRFPGHEKIPMIDSKMGPIPDGWQIGILEDAFVLQRGFDLPTARRLTGTVQIISASGISGTHDTAMVKGPGVVTGRSGSIGTVMFVWADFWPLNTTLWIKEYRHSTPLHAYHMLRQLDLASFNCGAAVPMLNRNDIKGLPTVLPSREVLKMYDEHVTTMFALKTVLTKRNVNLRTTRDFLLPKVISGEIRVEAAEEVELESVT